ncbi:MAG TPA: cyclodeaminase/cyclohydrolase family protein [Atopobiaceae bacterium]|nr:cyclodeaminase/cyclohydrolase family protein [Atopobiaceae bacterium]
MAEALTDKSCVEFADALAAKEPVPGGGGAAAYAGALGVALASMVGNFTAGKKRYAQYEDDIQRMLEIAEAIRRRLVALVDEDAAAFYPLSQAYGIPKEDPRRAEMLEEATRAAIVAPVEMMHQCCEAIALLEELCEKGSRMLLSDVGCGALLCRAALEAASLNVFVNTRVLASLGCAESAERIDRVCEELLDEWCPRAEVIEAKVMDYIRRRS